MKEALQGIKERNQTDVADTRSEVEVLLADMPKKLDAAGIKDDELRAVFDFFGVILKVVAEGTDALNAKVRDGAEAAVTKAQLRIAEDRELAVHAIEDAVHRALRDNQTAEWWRIGAVIGGIMFGALVVGLGVGFVVGRFTVWSTEASVSAAFKNGPGAAATWSKLMEHNDPRSSLGECQQASDGRRWCNGRFWIDAPKVEHN